MNGPEGLIAGFFFSFIGFYVAFTGFFWICRLFGLFDIVSEGEAKVYVLFGKVVGVLKEPGLYFLLWRLGWKGPFVNWLGSCYSVDMRLDQEYLRSQPVNSEEGAPMGIGIWYEMYTSDPVNFLFKNTDPKGSLGTNVRSSTVRCLSNMKLSDMLEDRHRMSLAVREEVTPKSTEWGFQVGSVYIRKVHFRDREMTQQIEEKVVNRLRQVTSAIRQDGANQVSVITSTAEQRAAAEFAKAGAVRPAIVGEALRKICQDSDISASLFEILETQKLLSGSAQITVLPKGKQLLSEFLSAKSEPDPVPQTIAPQQHHANLKKESFAEEFAIEGE